MSGTDDAGGPDDVTIWAGRLRAWPAADPTPEPAPEDLDEGTALSPRRRGTPAADAPADDAPEADTVLRPRAAPAEPALAEPALAEPAPAEPAAADATDVEDRTQLRRPPAEPAPPADATELRPRTRRDDAPRPTATSSHDARVPEALAREAYGPRRVDPVVAERRAVATPRALDAGAPPAPARRRIGRPAIIAGVVTIVLVLAAVALALVFVSL